MNPQPYTTNLSKTPDILKPYLFSMQDEQEDHHVHINMSASESFWDTMHEIFNSQHYQMSRLIKCAIKGAFVGAFVGTCLISTRHNFRQFQEVRRVFNNNRWAWNKITGNAMQGGAIGIAWYLWHYGLMSTHNNYSEKRYIYSHAWFGAALSVYLFVPSAFPYGFVAGLGIGIVNRIVNNKLYPPGFQLKLPGYTQEQRDKVQFENRLKLLGASTILQDHHQYVLPSDI